MDVGYIMSWSFVSIAIVLWYIWRKRRMTLFERLGIPGPKPHLITGNVNNACQQSNISLEWGKKYGKIYGIYMGAWPFLVVSDVELIKLIQIKEFKAFSGRASFITNLLLPHPIGHEVVFSQEGDRWKRARNVLTPVFTTGKLKKMMPITTEAVNVFLEKISITNQKPFDIKPLVTKLSFDINSRASFGFSTGIQHNENSDFIRSLYRSIDADSGDFLAMLITNFPELGPLPQILRIVRDKIRGMLNLPSSTTVIETCSQILKMRKCNPEAARPDLLQSLLDATKEFSTSSDQESNKRTSLHMPLTETEVLANAYGFMLGGFDIISIILSFCINYLTEYPQVQNKLREEIMEKVKDKVEYDVLNNMPYLDQVLSETLRMFPFNVTGFNRTTVKEFKYKNMIIPKNINIGIPLYALSMDKNYWKDPEVFRPERFSPGEGDINTTVYQPFGNGPRNCIGMRFAQVMMKTIIASLIQKYKLEKPPNAKKFELESTLFLVRPKSGVEIRAVPV